MANKYSKYTHEQLEEHFSNYLIDSWSYSAVSCFARNEKAFEMQYVYREKDRSGISAVVGNAYHWALRQFFCAFSPGLDPENVVNLTQAAYDYLDEVPANAWRLTGKVTSVDAAVREATSRINNLLKFFCAEASTYTEHIRKVLDVEFKFAEWIVLNGVDIPLPCHAIIDVVAELDDGRIVIMDHKSKSKYTDESEVVLVHGQQGITYVKVWEARNPGKTVSEVWFIENKESENKDKSAQLRKHIIKMDADSRRLYETLLYEPLRRMLEAVADPDYIYTINTSDNFVDKAVLYDFWARTQLCEVVDFEYVPEDKRALLEKRQRKIKDSSAASITPKIITEFRKNAASFITFDYAHSNMTNSEKIEHLLRTYNIKLQVAHVQEGFSCDTYLCDVAPGVEIASIYRHSLDIAYALDVPNVRIAGFLMMYEGKSYVAIEVNKKSTETLYWDKRYLDGHRIPLGLDNFRRPVYWDLDNHSTPHALVCGSTGSGKSVELISILEYAKAAGIKDIIIFDPKWEFVNICEKDVEVINEIADIEARMKTLVDDMNDRIRMRYSHLTLVIFDEFADANDQARTAKQLGEGEKTLQENFKMLLQKGRSCGFRFVAATQRADTRTINGTIKVNFPVLVCFRVPKALDSKVVIDEEGANTLAGRGDGLLRSPEYQDHIVRFQGFYHP